jgi:hypothetical protein
MTTLAKTAALAGLVAIALPTGGALADREPPDSATRTVVHFDPAKAEYPESAVYRDGSAYVTLVLTGQVLKVDYPTGARSLYAQLPTTPANFTLGLDFDQAGNLFVAVAAADPTDTAALAAAGVYKIPPGGEPELWAWGADTLKYASGLSFDPRGTLYVSDARAGAVYRFGPEGAPGTAQPWSTDPALRPDAEAWPDDIDFPVLGANGLVADKKGVSVANTSQGRIVRLAVSRTGASEPAVDLSADRAALQGIDGLRADPRRPGALLAANILHDSIVSVSRAGEVSVAAQGNPPFRTPVDIAHVTATKKPATVLVLVSSFGDLLAGRPGDPSLVELRLP